MVQLLTEAQIKKIYQNATSAEITQYNSDIYSTICQYCNTTFEPASYENEKQDYSASVLPEHRPVLEVTSLDLLVDGESIPLVESEDYYVYPRNLVMTNPDWSRKSLNLTYTAGYLKVPELVKGVALDILRFRAFKESEGSGRFIKKSTLEELSYEFDPGVTEESILSSLRSYIEPKSQSAIRGARNSGLRIGYVNG